MIPRIVPTVQTTDIDLATRCPSTGETNNTTWQDELAASVRDPEELFRLLDLPTAHLAGARSACRDFPLRVTRPFLDRMRKGDINDPLLRQVLPLGDELIAAPGYSADPLAEQKSNPAPGLIHKYRGRVLLVVSPNCAVNCRYCFRRHFPYRDNKPGRNQWQQVFDYIAADDSITEVIYSGGDPLAAADNHLAWLTQQIAGIPHVDRLRIHTRLPIVVPQRITEHLLKWFTNSRLRPVMVIHSNHANELDENVGNALRRLRNAGVALLNQTVLLKGINNSAHALINLNERLFTAGVMPYYLHVLDRVQGAAHFDVSEQEARQLLGDIMAALPGYLVPKLVREVAGANSKTPLTPTL